MQYLLGKNKENGKITKKKEMCIYSTQFAFLNTCQRICNSFQASTQKLVPSTFSNNHNVLVCEMVLSSQVKKKVNALGWWGGVGLCSRLDFFLAGHGGFLRILWMKVSLLIIFCNNPNSCIFNKPSFSFKKTIML